MVLTQVHTEPSSKEPGIPPRIAFPSSRGGRGGLVERILPPETRPGGQWHQPNSWQFLLQWVRDMRTPHKIPTPRMC